MKCAFTWKFKCLTDLPLLPRPQAECHTAVGICQQIVVDYVLQP
jgi:hypothetical protein